MLESTTQEVVTKERKTIYERPTAGGTIVLYTVPEGRYFEGMLYGNETYYGDGNINGTTIRVPGSTASDGGFKVTLNAGDVVTNIGNSTYYMSILGTEYEL